VEFLLFVSALREQGWFDSEVTMKFLLVAALVIVVILFGLSSVSQSYATAQQAQAAIEANRTAQIASTGNLFIIATLSVLLLSTLGVIVYLLIKTRQSGKHQFSKPSTGQMSQDDMNSLLPAMLTMLMYQMMQRQSQSAPDILFQSRYEEDLQLLEEEDIPWTI
jgi:uncharacterized protein YqgC (DUF456 family)